MIALLLHVVFSSAFTLLIKWAQQRGTENVITVGAINYIVAAVLIAPVFWMTNPFPVSWGALWTGGSMGAVYFIAYFFVIHVIRSVGASSTSVISVLSILMPIAVAAWYFNEVPTLMQSIGIGIALASLMLIGGNRAKKIPDSETPASRTAAWVGPLILFIFFVLCGFSRISQDAFKRVSHPDHYTAFLMAAFGAATIPSAVIVLARKKMPKLMEVLIGVAMGLSNLLQTYFLLLALEGLPAYLVFTLASGGGIVFTTVFATGLMGERLNGKTKIGITLAVIALVLLRWLPE